MTDAGPPPARRGPALPTLLGLACGAILVPLNSTMLAVALPSIRHEFGVGPSTVATLVTLYLGAVVVALGYANAGVFANDDAMYERLEKAQAKAGEKMWRLPLDDEYKENIRSNIADMVNSGGRWGGAINAAMFLKEFAEDTP